MQNYSVKSLYKFFTQQKEGLWVMQWPNPQVLYDFVRKHPMKRVLDLGTGIGLSASIISLALRDKGEKDYEVHTVEQFEKCHKLAQDIIPYQYFSVFKELPEGDFDFILTDGPGPYLEDGKNIDLPNGDVMKMLLEDRISSGNYCAWDGRISAIKTFERYFGENFYLVQSGDGS